MRSQSIVVAVLALVACTNRAPGERGEALSVIGNAASMVDDLTENTVFDFELSRPDLDAAHVFKDGSNVFKILGAAFERFPANAELGPFRNGMTLRQAERVAIDHSFTLTTSLGPDEAEVECAMDGSGANSPQVLRIVPRNVQINTEKDGSYSLRFTNDAGQSRLTAISWSPSADALTSAQWAAYLTRKFGKPTFREASSDYATLQWCSPNEDECEGNRDSELPSVTAHNDRLRGSMWVTVSLGSKIEDGPEIAVKPAGARADCVRELTRGEARLYSSYLASLADPFAPNARTVFRQSLLPTGLQQLLLGRLGRPDWFKFVGADVVARYEVGYSRDPASYSRIKYVAFTPTASGEFQSVWQGDAKTLHARYPATTAWVAEKQQ